MPDEIKPTAPQTPADPPRVATIATETTPPAPAPERKPEPEPERNGKGKTMKDLETEIAHLQDENHQLKSAQIPKADSKKSTLGKFWAGELD